MSSSPPFKQALREELLRAAARGPRRRRWPMVAAVGAIAAAAGSWLVLDTSPATADVEVRFTAGGIEVLLTDRTTTIEEVQEVFEDAGLDVRVDAVPAGPSNIGRFVGLLFDGPVEEVTNLRGLDRDGNAFSGFTVEDRWEGTLVLSMGRPARPGEPYALASDAFADDEPLDCSGILGRPLRGSLARLEDLTVRIEPSPEGFLGPLLDLTPATAEEYGSWIVTSGDAFAPDEVILRLQPTAPVPRPAETDC